MNRDYTYLIGNKFALGAKPNSGSFKKGLVPWNKGLKGIHLSPSTQFKKGQKGIHWKPVGSVSIRNDKNGTPRRHIKVEEPNIWKYYAVYVWEKKNGPIKRGLILHHIDHDSLNDDIKNLCLLTRAGHINAHRKEIAEAARKSAKKNGWGEGGKRCKSGARRKWD